MRKRWKEKYVNRFDKADDSPSDKPVSLADKEPSGLDDFEQALDWELCGEGGEPPLQASSSAASGNVTATRGLFVQPQAKIPAFMEHMDESKIKFVDSTKDASCEPSCFESVASAAPPVIVAEAARLTDKKTLLFPWEKGRLGRIFGEDVRLSLK